MKKDLQFFESIASERDVWKRKNWYYWEDLENFCCLLIPENARVLEVGCGQGI